MPVYKDLGSSGMFYCRSYGGTQMLVSEGTAGETLAAPDNEQGDVSMDFVARVGAQVAERFPSFETAGLASSWTGVYDVTPDWNPVLGRIPEVPGLVVAYGFSGHGFKLAPGGRPRDRAGSARLADRRAACALCAGALSQRPASPRALRFGRGVVTQRG